MSSTSANILSVTLINLIHCLAYPVSFAMYFYFREFCSEFHCNHYTSV